METIILLGIIGLYVILHMVFSDSGEDIDGHPVNENDPQGGRKAT